MLIATLTLGACLNDDAATTNTGGDGATDTGGDGATDDSGDGDGDPGDGDGDTGDSDGSPGDSDGNPGDSDGDSGEGLGETCDSTAQMVPSATSLTGPKLEATITLAGDATVGDLRVAVDVVEAMSSDYLEIYLSHAGTTIVLFHQSCDENTDIQVTFDDAAGALACCNDWLTCSGDPIIGDAAPVEPLSTFAGMPVAGDWTLEVFAPVTTDPMAPYQAILDSWCLDISG